MNAGGNLIFCNTMVVWIKCDVLYYGGSLGNMVVVEGTIATYTKHLGT